MTDSWDDRVDRFWSSAGASQPDAVLAGIRALVEERPDGDADALYELASAYDFLGREADAIPLYWRAIASGLDGDRLPQARIQLASSLRIVGQPEAAIDILSQMESSPITGDAHRAFLALALFDAGRQAAALEAALDALARTLPRYGAVVGAYAADLKSRDMKTL